MIVPNKSETASVKKDLKSPINRPIPTRTSKKITISGDFFNQTNPYSKSSRLSGSSLFTGTPSFSIRNNSLKEAIATST